MLEAAKRKIRVLIVDDSIVMRAILRRALRTQPDIQVVGEAACGREALERIEQLDPTVVTLDIEMPGMSGIEVLEKVMRTRPRPVLMVSTLTQSGAHATFDCLEKGAIDYVAKPLPGQGVTLQSFSAEVVEKVRAAAGSNRSLLRRAATRPETAKGSLVTAGLGRAVPQRVVAIGISAGGPATLVKFLPLLPADFVPVAIAQHMPAQFTGPFAERLDDLCQMHVKEAEKGEPFERGKILLAPGDWHLRVIGRIGRWMANLDHGPKVSGFRPSVDVLLESLAQAAGPHGIGVVMTGIGSDGSRGICAVKEAGGITVAQDEASSIVYGMPKSAAATGCVDHICNLARIDTLLVELARSPTKACVQGA